MEARLWGRGRLPMLIEFRVENHRSLRDEQVLTMEAGRVSDDADPRPRRVPGYAESLLPVTALYGANASGKRNALFLSAAAQHGHPQLTRIFSWFGAIQPVKVMAGRPYFSRGMPIDVWLARLIEEAAVEARQVMLFSGEALDESLLDRFHTLL